MMKVFKYTNGMPKRYFKMYSSMIAGVRTDTLHIGYYAIQNVYAYRSAKSGGIYGRLFRKVWKATQK